MQHSIYCTPIMKTPSTYTPETLFIHCREVKAYIEPHGWVACRPESFRSLALLHRLKSAWLVFTGKADVLKWTGQ